MWDSGKKPQRNRSILEYDRPFVKGCNNFVPNSKNNYHRMEMFLKVFSENKIRKKAASLFEQLYNVIWRTQRKNYRIYILTNTPTLKCHSRFTKNGKVMACRILFSFKVCSTCFNFTTLSHRAKRTTIKWYPINIIHSNTCYMSALMPMSDEQN